MPIKNIIMGRERMTIDGFPVKVYVFNTYRDRGGMQTALEDTERIMRSQPETRSGSLYGIAVTYLLPEETDPWTKGLDVVSGKPLEGDDNWTGNFLYKAWNFENGFFVPAREGVSCGVGFRIVSEEDQLREQLGKEFLDKWPDTPAIHHLLEEYQD